jgi:DNA-binding protein H-NS
MEVVSVVRQFPALAGMNRIEPNLTTSNETNKMTEQETVTPDSEQSLSDAVAELRTIDERRRELEGAISQRKKDFLMEVVSVVKKYITDNGYEVAEIVKHLTPVQRAKSGKRKQTANAPRRVYALNSDPSLTYTKGVMPGWMKDSMTANGYDAADATARNEFRSKYMSVVGEPVEEKVADTAIEEQAAADTAIEEQAAA